MVSTLWQCVNCAWSQQPGWCSLTCQKHLFSTNHMAVSLKTKPTAQEVLAISVFLPAWSVLRQNAPFHFTLYLLNTRYVRGTTLGTMGNTRETEHNLLGNTQHTHWTVRTNKGQNIIRRVNTEQLGEVRGETGPKLLDLEKTFTVNRSFSVHGLHIYWTRPCAGACGRCWRGE